MPELPEVQTTVNGLREKIIGLTITDVWSDYDSPHFKGSDTIKDRRYFRTLRTCIIGARVYKVDRRAKNILIHIQTINKEELVILVHMKMTGHLLYGTYRFDAQMSKDPWQPIDPQSLKDPYNRHVHFLISFDNKRHLALSDVRKFAKVTLLDVTSLHTSAHVKDIGPEPLENKFTFHVFEKRVMLRPTGKIKQVLMDQSVLAGIGNIYADESLWRAGIHPLEKVRSITRPRLLLLFSAIKTTLSHGIDFGGDSTSDYRNVDGEKGEFHEKHHAYQRTGSRCDKRGCTGKIVRTVLGGRGTHFCDTHQKLGIKKKR